MCNCNESHWFTVTALSTFGIAARFTKIGTVNEYLTPDDVDSVTITVHKVVGKSKTLIATYDEIDEADVFFAELQTNDQWLNLNDSAGYDFLFKLAVADEQTSYHIDALIVLTNGETVAERWQIRTK